MGPDYLKRKFDNFSGRQGFDTAPGLEALAGGGPVFRMNFYEAVDCGQGHWISN